MRLVKGTRAEVVAKLEAEGLPPITLAFHKALHEACQDVRELLELIGQYENSTIDGESNVQKVQGWVSKAMDVYQRLSAKYSKKDEGETK